MRNGAVLWAAAIGLVGWGLGFLGGLGGLAAEQLTPEEEQRILRENVERLKQQIAEREGMQKPSPIVPQNAPQSPQIAPQSPPNAPQPTQTPQAAQAQEKKFLPRPTQAELQQAEKAVQEVFGREIAQARSAQEKAKLAQEMIKTAREEKDAAVRFALAQRAKQMAVQAQDSKLAVQAAEMLAEFEPEGGPLSPKQAADKAHGLWAKSELARGPERLARRMEAAELYLQALPDLEGFEKAIAERRLKELGWEDVGAPPEKIMSLFALNRKDWQITKADIIEGNVGNFDDSWIWIPEAIEAKELEFTIVLQAKWYHCLLIEIDGARCIYSRGHWWNEGLLIDDYINKKQIVKRPGPNIETPTNFHSLRVRIDNSKFTIFYDGQIQYEGAVPQTVNGKHLIRVGFASHDTKLQIKNVFLKFK